MQLFSVNSVKNLFADTQSVTRTCTAKDAVKNGVSSCPSSLSWGVRAQANRSLRSCFGWLASFFRRLCSCLFPSSSQRPGSITSSTTHPDERNPVLTRQEPVLTRQERELSNNVLNQRVDLMQGWLDQQTRLPIMPAWVAGTPLGVERIFPGLEERYLLSGDNKAVILIKYHGQTKICTQRLNNVASLEALRQLAMQELENLIRDPAHRQAGTANCRLITRIHFTPTPTSGSSGNPGARNHSYYEQKHQLTFRPNNTWSSSSNEYREYPDVARERIYNLYQLEAGNFEGTQRILNFLSIF
jgi:hypothetical protein